MDLAFRPTHNSRRQYLPLSTFDIEMAHPEGRSIGIGNMDDQRLQRLIERIVRVKHARMLA